MQIRSPNPAISDGSSRWLLGCDMAQMKTSKHDSLDNPILFLATANAERSRSFFEGKLGLKFVADEPVALVFQVGGSMLRIQKVDQIHRCPIHGFRMGGLRYSLDSTPVCPRRESDSNATKV